MVHVSGGIYRQVTDPLAGQEFEGGVALEHRHRRQGARGQAGRRDDADRLPVRDRPPGRGVENVAVATAVDVEASFVAGDPDGRPSASTTGWPARWVKQSPLFIMALVSAAVSAAVMPLKNTAMAKADI